MAEKILEGKLSLYAEQGMEGGYLSIQDSRFISLKSSLYGITNGEKVWDKKDIKRHGFTSDAEVLRDNIWLELPDPIWKDKDFEISTIYCGEQNGDFKADRRLAEKYGFIIKYAHERLNEFYGAGNWKIDKKLPNVILKDGTHLSIGDTPTTIPSRPYGIPEGGKTRVTVHWKDGRIDFKKSSDDLLVERGDIKGLHFLKAKDILKVKDPDTNSIICEGQVDLMPLKIFSGTIKGHFDQLKGQEICNWEKYFVENFHAELYRTQ